MGSRADGAVRPHPGSSKIRTNNALGVEPNGDPGPVTWVGQQEDSSNNKALGIRMP